MQGSKHRGKEGPTHQPICPLRCHQGDWLAASIMRAMRRELRGRRSYLHRSLNRFGASSVYLTVLAMDLCPRYA